MNTPRHVLCLLLAAVGLTLAASASLAAEHAGACIEASSSTSWTGYDSHSILVRSGSRSFLAKTDTCPRLADPMTHITVDLAGGAPICGPHDVHLYVTDNADRIPVPCTIQSIRPLTRDEARALSALGR